MDSANFDPELDGLEQSSTLTDREKELRNRFVDEYLVDYDAVGACRIIGFGPELAIQYAIRFMECSYVRRRIREKELEPVDEAKEALEQEYDKRRIKKALFKEANSRGIGSSHSARVSALSKLASIYGMEAPIKTSQEVTHRGGVMLAPAIADVTEWERAAKASQEQLMKDARG